MSANLPNPQSTSAQSNESRGRAGIISAVKTPLALFALVFLISEAILGGMATRANGRDFTLLVIGMLLILITVVIAVAASDLKGKAAPRQLQQTLDPVVNSKISRTSNAEEIPDRQMEEHLEKIRHNVLASVRRNHEILSEEISAELNDLVIRSRNWSRGEMRTPVQRYNSVLLTLYDHAKESIFSTTNRDYLAAWPDELMEKMITASERARAKSVTRVFVFGKKEEIDERAIEVLKRFKQCSKIRSLVYVDSDDFKFNFPPDVSRDFVVIDDGEEIGVTVSYGRDNLEAIWYFGDENRKQTFHKTCCGLEDGSKSVDDVLSWWETTQKTQGD